MFALCVSARYRIHFLTWWIIQQNLIEVGNATQLKIDNFPRNINYTTMVIMQGVIFSRSKFEVLVSSII